MTQTSIDKIKETEMKAEAMVATAKNEKAEAISTARSDFETAMDNLRNETDSIIASKVDVAKQEAESIKSSREVEIKEKMKAIITEAKGNIGEAVDFVVEATLKS